MRRTIPDLPVLPSKTTPLANKLDPGIVATRIVELQHYLEYVLALHFMCKSSQFISVVASLYKARISPVFKKFLETNRKYADETYEPPEPKSYSIDCISTALFASDIDCLFILLQFSRPRVSSSVSSSRGATWTTFLASVSLFFSSFFLHIEPLTRDRQVLEQSHVCARYKRRTGVLHYAYT